MSKTLADAIRRKQVILFVGAGVSQNLGLPSFRALIDLMAELLSFDPAVFGAYAGYAELAEFYYIQKGSLGSLRSEIDKAWHKDEARVDSSAVHQAIMALDFPIIYTTNYDNWIEIAYERARRPFSKIVTVGDFTRLTNDATQIIKFHGDFSDDKSLVLTEASYFDRLSFESPLDIKLRADAIGKAILFIGYSLSDINIRYLLYKLHRLWADSDYSKARPDSYIFLPRPNRVQEAVLGGRGIQAIPSTQEDPAEGLRVFLEGLL